MSKHPKDTFHIPADDGWTMPGYLAEEPNVHGELRFTYRPTLVSERSKIIASLNGKKSHIQDQELAKALAFYLKTWSIEVDGKPQPITAEFIKLLKYQVWDRLIAIVIYGSGTSDTDPEWDAPTKEEEDLLEYEAAEQGRRPASVRQEVHEGNSGGG